MTLKTTVGGLMMTSEYSGKERETRLQRGLIISVLVGKKTTRLRLRRNDSKPSLAEWRTVLAALPYPIAPIEPEPLNENGVDVLQASWPTPVRLFDD
jgi:hypothetical protein